MNTKKYLAAPVLMLGVLLYTNPSEKQFQKFAALQESKFPEKFIRSARINYYGIYSIYQYDITVDYSYHKSKYYYGILGNFIPK